MKIKMKRRFKISCAQTGKCYGRRRGDSPVAALKRLIAAAGIDESGYEMEVVRLPHAEPEFVVSRRGENLTYIAVREISQPSGS